MPEVTCPRCETRQPIEAGAAGYTCVRCGARWVFAMCENCGQRFHMPPDATSWTCPNCGHQNGAPARESTAPADAPTRRAPADAPTTPAPSSAAERRRRLRLGTIALVAIAAIVLGSFLLTRGDGTTGTQSPSADAVATMCLHLRDLQTPRVDAFTRAAAELAADADAIDAAGNPQTAAAVRRLRRAVIGYRDALQTQGGDDSAAAGAMAHALLDPDIPC
jgi:predicted  nucleic acid-binding Zn-ribbon protein